LTYKKGSKVEVKNEDERKWYTATILNGYPDNTYDVEFADDTQEYNVPEHLIKPLYGVQQVAKNPVLQTPLQYAPPSPDYTVHSPDYMPRSPDYMPRSPDYMPRSQDYMPRSPDYIPRSPDYTPPGTPLNHFKVGDLVSYTKDFKNRMWKIDDLEGAYVTVATEDTEGLERNYKVVPLNELTPYVPSSPPAPAPAAPQTPVVNVIVGDNNSVTPPEKPMQSSSSQSSSSQSSPQDSSSYGLSSFSLSDESSDFSTPRVRIKEDTKASVSDSKLLSGGSIVVKKI
jgi:hypothetical protein